MLKSLNPDFGLLTGFTLELCIFLCSLAAMCIEYFYTRHSKFNKLLKHLFVLEHF